MRESGERNTESRESMKEIERDGNIFRIRER